MYIRIYNAKEEANWLTNKLVEITYSDDIGLMEYIEPN